MGIYVFSWNKLRKYLTEDQENPESSNDFGKDVLPTMLNAGEKMFAYEFHGYWKDVGTIDSLWEANMDLLDPKLPLDLSDENWKIYSRNPVMPPQYIGDNAIIQNSLVADGCNVYGEIDFAVLFAGVSIAPGAVVKDSIIMPGAKVEEGAVVQYAIVSENAVIGKNAVVGARPEDIEEKDGWGITVIGDNVKVGAGAVVPPKTMIDKDIPEVTEDARQ